jgi:hypothetical protein
VAYELERIPGAAIRESVDLKQDGPGEEKGHRTIFAPVLGFYPLLHHSDTP